MDSLYTIESLAKLKSHLESQPQRQLRKRLTKEFFKVCCYSNAQEWNRAARLCEALAIIGWGDYEPVQAAKGVAWNGFPETAFFNRYSERRFLNAAWSKRKAGLTIDSRDSSYFESPDLPKKPTRIGDYPIKECVQNIKLNSQRNWILKNPILISAGITNCYPNSQKLMEAIDNSLMPALETQMEPENYGPAVDRIVIDYSLSYDDESGPCNYILLDEDVRLSSTQLYNRLRKMYSAKEIDKNGYYLRKRYDFGGFQKADGYMKVRVHFSKEFSQQPLKAQKRQFAKCLTDVIDGVVSRLNPKKLDYDFDCMSRDFKSIVAAWQK